MGTGSHFRGIHSPDRSHEPPWHGSPAGTGSSRHVPAPLQIPSVHGLSASQDVPLAAKPDPVQTPAEQTPPMVQGRPTSQTVPSAAARWKQADFPSSDRHTSLVQGLPSDAQAAPGSRLIPKQNPSTQASLVVQELPSSQAVCSGKDVPVQTPPVQTSLTVQTLPSLQTVVSAAGVPAQTPPVQASLTVQILPSSQTVVSAAGV